MSSLVCCCRSESAPSFRGRAWSRDWAAREPSSTGGGIATAYEHDARLPRDHWLVPDEEHAVHDFHLQHPLAGYRRLTFMGGGRLLYGGSHVFLKAVPSLSAMGAS